MPTPNLSNRLVPLICAVALLLFCAFGDRLNWVQALDNSWLDVVTRARAQHHRAPDDIVVIDIDQYSLNLLADDLGNWPWPRAAHGELVEWLQTQGVKQIAFDIWFSEPDVFNRSSDEYFGEVLNQFDNIYLPTMELQSNDSTATPLIRNYRKGFGFERTAFSQENGRALFFDPIVGDRDKLKIGSINLVADGDGIARRYDVVREIRGWRILSLPARMARDNGVEIPKTKRFILDWYGSGSGPFQMRAYGDVYQAVRQAATDEFWQGKTVFIGSTAEGIHDLKPTPMSAQYPGLYMLATAYANLRSNQHYNAYNLWSVLPLGLLPLILMVFMQSSYKKRVRHPQALITTVFALSLFCAFSVSYYLGMNAYQLPVLSMAILATAIFVIGLAQQYVSERRSRQHAVAVFSRFLDPRVVANLTAEGLTPETLQARAVELTILFSDIRGFTTLSETRAPAEIMALLNAYFSRQVAIIFEHNGTLDKFIGDAIMAFWGAPMADPNHAADAVKAALAMSQALDEFKRERNLPDFDIGIGVHTGPAVVGMLGSEQRLEYTAIGDTINLGSRLEGLTKDKARILVSESTQRACAEQFVFREMGSFQVKGRNEPVTVYEPLAIKKEPS